MSEPAPAGDAFGTAPGLDDIAALAEQAYAALPERFRRLAGEVLFRVEDFPAEEVLDSLGIEDAFELTGLYQGAGLTERSLADLPGPPPMVFLYRRPILDEWVDRGDVSLAELVSHVVVHEIGHHFGLTDAQIAAIEAQGL